MKCGARVWAGRVRIVVIKGGISGASLKESDFTEGR